MNRVAVAVASDPDGATYEAMLDKSLEQTFYAIAEQAPKALAEPCKTHFKQKGKHLRGKLAFASARLYGASHNAAVSWATAVELLHNASLVHDDVCDKDSKRRGQRTIYRQYGEAIAVCLGDYLIAKAFEYGGKIGTATLPHLSASIATLVGGQAAEFTAAGYPNWEAYEQIATDKTAPLLSLTVVGAAAAGHGQIPPKDIESYFQHAALCFQIINDIKNFSGSDGAEAPCSDLANCRPNAVIASFTETLPKQLNARFALWADRIRSGEIIADAVETREWWQRLCDSDAFSDTAQRLHFHFNMASTALARLPPDLQAVVTCLNQWLALELTKTQHCMAKHCDN
jgi:geranylgeranyl pyrophosphate synthase